MEGYIIEFEGRSLLTKLLGRIVLVNYRGRKSHYYSKGILHSVKFKKLLNKKYFIVTEDKKVIKELENYFKKYSNKYTIKKENRNIPENNLITGVQYWSDHCNEKGITIKNWARKI